MFEQLINGMVFIATMAWTGIFWGGFLYLTGYFLIFFYSLFKGEVSDPAIEFEKRKRERRKKERRKGYLS